MTVENEDMFIAGLCCLQWDASIESPCEIIARYPAHPNRKVPHRIWKSWLSEICVAAVIASSRIIVARGVSVLVAANALLDVDFMHETNILSMLSSSEAGIETDAVARMESHNGHGQDEDCNGGDRQSVLAFCRRTKVR